MHSWRLRKYKTVGPSALGKWRPLQERFENNVNVYGPIPHGAAHLGACAIWTGTVLNGYGVIGGEGRRIYAHRLAYEMAWGELPKGTQVRHQCGTKLCVREDHLCVAGSDDEKRFWQKVDENGPFVQHLDSRCWLWTAGLSNGYGSFRAGGKTTSAHRFAYQLMVGDIGELEIDHRCHNLACVNPTHLRRATRKQNSENRSTANRNSRSGIRGVSWNEGRKCWQAEVKHGNKRHYATFRGRNTGVEEAIRWVEAKRLELFSHNDADHVGSQLID